MREQGKPTRYPGVFLRQDKRFRVCAAVMSQTGKEERIERVVDAEDAEHAASILRELKQAARAGRPTTSGSRLRVRDVADGWIEARKPSLDARTYTTHKNAVHHIIVGLGDYFVDALDKPLVQGWVNDALEAEYSPTSIKGWLRRLSTMAKDLEFPRDPALRIDLPETEEKENRLTPAQLPLVLAEYRKLDLDTYALIVVMAYTGLRFTHASALKWEDISEWKVERRMPDGTVVEVTVGAVRVQRKNVLGVIGAVSKKKRAPKVMPLAAEVLEVLREHRARQVFKAEVWCFPNQTLHRDGRVSEVIIASHYLDDAFKAALAAAKVTQYVNIHGLRRTFSAFTLAVEPDQLIRQSLVPHGLAQQAHYEGVNQDRQRQAVENVVAFAPLRKEEGT